MKKLLIAVAAAGLLLTAAACDNSAAPTHTKAKAKTNSGVVTSMAYTQSMDTGRSCKHTPTQAECASQWTIAYRDKVGHQHVTSVTEAAYNRCLRHFPGGRYPACADG